MGHRRSHHRESRGGSPDHKKEKHDLHESSCGGSKRDKKSHRRKKERDHVSKRRHKERHRGSHSSSKPSRKGKSRDKVHRQDFGSSGSDGGRSILSSQAEHQLGIITHHSGADGNLKRAGSKKTDLDDEGHRKNSSKRVRVSEEKPGSHDALIEHSRAKRGEYKAIDSEPWKMDESMGAVFSSNAPRLERDTAFMKSQEEEMCSLQGRKENVLEVELRQKALANFMRHQDISWRADAPVSDDEEARQGDTCKEQKACVKIEVVDRQMPALGNPRPGRSGTAASPSDDVEENMNNLEEGEIKSGNETEQENGSFVGEKFLSKKTEGNHHTTRETCEKQDDLRISSRKDVEKAEISNASRFVNVKEDNEQEQTAKENTDGNLASAQPNTSNNFQEKTMSVMRGGEMVQVSCKVYIPQRAAELARRRLQR